MPPGPFPSQDHRESFRPSWFLRNGHVQTLVGTYVFGRLRHDRNLPPIQTNIVEVDVSDGDRLAYIDDCPEGWQPGDRVALLLHGLAGSESSPYMARLAAKYPGVRITVDHMGGRGGLTTLKDDAAMVHIPELVALGKFSNVAVKATGAPGYCSGSYPFASMHGYLKQIFDAFGPNRMFWGTDISKMPCSWKQCAEMFTRELPWLTRCWLALLATSSITMPNRPVNCAQMRART